MAVKWNKSIYCPTCSSTQCDCACDETTMKCECKQIADKEQRAEDIKAFFENTSYKAVLNRLSVFDVARFFNVDDNDADALELIASYFDNKAIESPWEEDNRLGLVRMAQLRGLIEACGLDYVVGALTEITHNNVLTALDTKQDYVINWEYWHASAQALNVAYNAIKAATPKDEDECIRAGIPR